ncbi:MAG: hypothetical protein KUG72_09365 [Pseudomonadales bacterium]|nr:hypothetical protein [Pseudomonadales bacterium]
MSIYRRVLLFILCSTPLLIQGCNSWQVNELSAALPAVGPQKTLLELEKITPSQRDRVQYLLNRGILNLYLAELESSRKDLEEAKAIILSLQAVSLSENMAAYTASELLRSYGGSPSDKVLVHVMLALSYLMSGDLIGARVEVLQADSTMQQLDDGETSSGQLASARFISGMIYELGGEFDDALISYRRAYKIMTGRNETIPLALQTSLLTLSQRQGQVIEYQQYSQQFSRVASVQNSDEGEWFVIYYDGLVSNKAEARISVYDPGANAVISVVMPQYYPSTYRPASLILNADSHNSRTQIIEHMEVRVREDLNRKKAGILAAATVRAIAKYQLSRGAGQQDPLIGALVNLAALASEQADVRSWNMLPASIQIARIPVKLNQQLELINKSRTLPAIAQLTPSKYAVLLVSSLTPQLHSYPVNEAISALQ